MPQRWGWFGNRVCGFIALALAAKQPNKLCLLDKIAKSKQRAVQLICPLQAELYQAVHRNMKRQLSRASCTKQPLLCTAYMHTCDSTARFNAMKTLGRQLVFSCIVESRSKHSLDHSRSVMTSLKALKGAWSGTGAGSRPFPRSEQNCTHVRLWERKGSNWDTIELSNIIGSGIIRDIGF